MLMNIRLALFVAVFTVSSVVVTGQEHQSVLSAPDNWKSEQFDFPISFAPSINYSGFEDLRFAPSWSDSTSQNFWTYMFVWYVDPGPSITTTKLSKELEIYYDGLMGMNANDSIGPPSTKCKLVSTNEGFEGSIQVYDAFFTKKEMTLFVKVREVFCNIKNKQIIIFELSRSNFEKEILELFKEVKLKVDCN